MKVVLYQPQIPQNTGNIVRTCSVTGADLILVRPLGFSVNDRWLKRAGLDYWEGVNVDMIDDLESFLNTTPHPFYFFSSKASTCYTAHTYESDALLIFGSETSGLPPELMARWPERYARLPMRSGARCLNLATAAGIVVYEAWRQHSFT